MVGLVSLIPLLLVVLILGAAIQTMVKGLTLPPMLRGTSSAGVCGRCGYEVGYGHTEQCPECGQRYAVTGILTPVLAKSMRPPFNNVVAGWTLLILLPLIGAFVTLAVIGSNNAKIDQTILWSIAGAVLLGSVAFYISGIVAIASRRRKIFSPRPMKGNASVPTPETPTE